MRVAWYASPMARAAPAKPVLWPPMPEAVREHEGAARPRTACVVSGITTRDDAGELVGPRRPPPGPRRAEPPEQREHETPARTMWPATSDSWRVERRKYRIHAVGKDVAVHAGHIRYPPKMNGFQSGAWCSANTGAEAPEGPAGRE